MKRLLNFIFFFQLLAMTGACQKTPLPKPLPTPQPKYPTNLEVVWLAPFFSDSVGGWIWDFQVANEQYIVVAKHNADERPQGIGIYNMQTGKRHSAWQNDPAIFEVGDVEDLRGCKTAGKNKEIILIYNKRAVFGYSLHSGQRLWSTAITPMGVPQMSADKNHAYISYSANGGFSKSWCRLAKVDVYSGKKTDILQLNIEDNFEFAILPPSSYVSSNGDTLLFFTTDCENYETNEGQGNAYCYNLTKKQMVWISKQPTEAEDRGAAFIQPPPYIIENDKLIITGRYVIYCLDKNTGNLIWKKEGLRGISDSPPLYWEGKLYVRYNDPCILICLDAQTGVQIWENTVINPIPAPEGRMAIYKDKLYFAAWGANATHHLGCVDINTGKELWRDRGPWGNICFDVLIDQKTGYLYCYTGWGTMCVDLNKTPKK